jgi:tetratricopeptide (TPR) repeat protein/serine/threonine protein kinase
MVAIPVDLARALAHGDAVLWAGAGLGVLAQRPGWAELLRHVVDAHGGAAQAELHDLLEQGRLRTVASYIHRHHGDAPLHDLLAQIQRTSPPITADGAAELVDLPWLAMFASAYPDLLVGLAAQRGRALDVIAHTDVHHLRLRDQDRGSDGARREPFVLRTPPTGRAMRADAAFYDLVEEAVRTRVLVFLGFDIDDPDLLQILALLGRVGRGRRHYALMPWVTDAEAEELLETYGIEVVTVPAEVGVPAQIAALAAAARSAPAGTSQAGPHLAALDLAKALRAVPIRADLALDDALGVDLDELRQLLGAATAEGSLPLDPGAALRAGSVLLAHGDLAGARRLFQTVITRGAGREYEVAARYDLALVAFADGDGFGALEGFQSAAESDRGFALVPPRFEPVEILGRDGTRMLLSVRDREGGEHHDIDVAMMPRAVADHEVQRFYAEVHKLAMLDHPAIQRVRGGFADGRLFGLLSAPAAGFSLASMLAQDDRLELSRAFAILGPVLRALAHAHAAGVIHRLVHPRQIVVTADGPLLRGFGLTPTASHHRGSVRQTMHGYLAPELLRGASPSPITDAYSAAAVLYHCVTGTAPLGSVPRLTALDPDADPRLDGLLVEALHPEPGLRPSVMELHDAVRRILTTPRPHAATIDTSKRATPAPAPAAAAAPASAADPSHGLAPAAAEVGAPTPLVAEPSRPLELPRDPDDLEGWAFVLERKPTHLEARRAVERIEADARAQGKWDVLAEVLNVRAQHTQVQRERVELLRELSRLFEDELSAPQSAMQTLQALLEEVPVPLQVELCRDLLRLAASTGAWGELAAVLEGVAARAPEPGDRERLLLTLGDIYATQLGASDAAIAALERAVAVDHAPLAALRAIAPLYRRAGRSAELAATLLALAELEEADDRHERLTEAAELLVGALDEADAALDAAQLVLTEARSDSAIARRARTVAERIARGREDRALLGELLLGRAAASHDEAEAIASLREAVAIAVDDAAALRGLDALVRHLPDDGELRRERVVRLRAVTRELPQRSPELIDALEAWAPLLPAGEPRAAVHGELAGLYDGQSDGGGRALDARERVVDELPLGHPLAVAAWQRLRRDLLAAGDTGALARLLRRIGAASDVEADARTEALVALVALARDDLADPAAEREALEGLCALQPEHAGWRDALLRRLVDDGDLDRAAPVLREQIAHEGDPRRRAALLVTAARMRTQQGDTGAAIAALLEAVELDGEVAATWLDLREAFDAAGQPLKAVGALERAADTGTNPLERVARGWEAAQELLRLDEDDRAVARLEAVVALDPDHREATAALLERLTARGEWARAWPHAQAHVVQIRAQAPDDGEALLRALGTAGRCALAVGEGERARELLARAKALDPTNLATLRLLADLDLDAGRYADAVGHYQSVILGAGARLPASEQADIYVRIARARVGAGEPDKAVPVLERALDLAPDHSQALAELRHVLDRHGSAHERVRVRERELERLAAGGEDTASAQRQAELLREVAELQAKALGDTAEAVRTLERLHALQPDDPAVLHQLLDLLTAAQRWLDATNVLSRLADGQADPVARAKIRYAGAVLLRDQVADAEQALAWMRQVVADDPLHEKGYRALAELYAGSERWRELARLVRERLRALPDTAEPGVRVALLEELAGIYEDKLHEPATALAAWEQLLAAPSPDEDGAVARRRKVFELAVQVGPDGFDKAMAQAHALIAARPSEFDTYHRLVGLYLDMGKRGRAASVARTLRFLKQASPTELALIDAVASGSPRASLRPELWRPHVVHPRQDPRLGELFVGIWPMLAARVGHTLGTYGLDASAKEEVHLQARSGLGRFVAYAAQLLDSPVPELYARAREPGGIAVAGLLALKDGQAQAILPTLIAGRDALARQPDPVLSFRAARAVALARPDHVVAAVLPAAASLRSAVYGAYLVAQGGEGLSEDIRRDAEPYATEIRRYLPPTGLETLRQLVRRVVDDGAVDARAWAIGVAHTVARAGFVVCDSLDAAGAVITQDGDAGAMVSAKERVKDLIAYSVSEAYLALREKLGMDER